MLRLPNGLPRAPSSGNPYRLRFERSVAGQLELRDRGIPAVTNPYVRMDLKKCLDLSFFFYFCAGVFNYENYLDVVWLCNLLPTLC